jgi:hypothetical protein
MKNPLVRPPNGGSPVAYGSLRAAIRARSRSRSHEFSRFGCRMIPCAQPGGGSKGH